MGLSLVTPPVVEPITTSEAKAHLRVDGSEENAVIDLLIKTARRRAEALTGRALINQTWDYVLDAPTGPIIRIPLNPVSSVTSISFTDKSAVTTVYPSANYVTDTISVPGRVILKSGHTWDVDLQEANGMEIQFVAGYGTAPENVPDDIRQAIFMLVGAWFENREAIATGTITAKIPPETNELLWPYRVFLT